MYYNSMISTIISVPEVSQEDFGFPGQYHTLTDTFDLFSFTSNFKDTIENRLVLHRFRTENENLLAEKGFLYNKVDIASFKINERSCSHPYGCDGKPQVFSETTYSLESVIQQSLEIFTGLRLSRLLCLSG